MKTRHSYILLAAAALFLAACQGEEDPMRESYRQMTFAVQPGQSVTRAYTSYEAGKYPATMGVYGYHDAFSAANMIFSNIQQNAPADMETSTAWTYAQESDKRYWEDYATFSSFDFFAYMPYAEDGISLTKTDAGEEYTLSVPVTVADGVVTDPTQTTMLCNTPVHKSIINQSIGFKMDQALTGFRVMFELGDKMDEIRDFVITAVTITGDKSAFTTSGTVSRTYTYSDSEGWTAGNITWSGLTNSLTDDPEIALTHSDPSLTLNDTEFQQWGNDFYVIPNTGFTPTIKVTYDVTVKDSENNTITTRHSVTSSVTLNNTNFSNYYPATAGAVGTVFPIHIKIVPSYLYVLTDVDQDSGYIVIK